VAAFMLEDGDGDIKFCCGRMGNEAAVFMRGWQIFEEGALIIASAESYPRDSFPSLQIDFEF
jgi:hypothetical protein